MKYKLTLKFGPLRVDRVVEAKDGAELERIISQADAFFDIDMPDRIWRDPQFHVCADVLREPKWLGRQR